jgi:hypothetical protein
MKVFKIRVTGICVVDENPSDWPLDDLLSEVLSAEVEVEEMVGTGRFDRGRALPGTAPTPKPLDVPLKTAGGSHLKSRESRRRKGGSEAEYRYYSDRYMRFGKMYNIGTLGRYKGKGVIWLTCGEVLQIRQLVVNHRNGHQASNTENNYWAQK